MSNKKFIHFIGVGGVGMSGIALVAHAKGFKVTGSDMKASSGTKRLQDAGIKVYIGHDACNLADDVDAVVISTAIPEKNPELVLARKRGIKVLHRSHMLARLGEGLKTLACAGTHGKTTTSSMLASTIERMGLKPSFLIGGTVGGYNTNAIAGEGEFYVVEADESDGSFVHLSPYIALITNIEEDHLDHYGTIEAIYDAFLDFMSLIPAEGAAVVCGDNPIIAQLAHKAHAHTVVYGDASHASSEVGYKILGKNGIGYDLEITFPDGKVVSVSIPRSPGMHNVMNACGVMAVCWVAGLDVDAAAKALATFDGVGRRFDLVGQAGGITVVDDYAHHPTEIEATLKAARALDYNHVHVLFQPHRYSRVQLLADTFAGAFDYADNISIMDIYAACEAPIPGVTGKLIVDSILQHNARLQCAWMPHRQDIIPYLKQKLEPGDLIITMGAGDVTALAPHILEAFKD